MSSKRPDGCGGATATGIAHVAAPAGSARRASAKSAITSTCRREQLEGKIQERYAQQSNDPVPCLVNHVSFMLQLLLGRMRKQFRGRRGLIHVEPPRKPKGGPPSVCID
jgi:hypothetical protein